MLYRNVIPATGGCGSTSSLVEQLDSSCPVSAGAALLPVMSSATSSDAAHCSSSAKSITTDTLPRTLASGENISSTKLSSTEYSARLSHSEAISARNMYEDRGKQFPPKSRNRRTQLKMLADNLSRFYAPSAGGKRRELLAQKRSAIDVERSARERQLEVIRRQVSLVEKRKKAELEMAAAASHSDTSEPGSRPVHATDLNGDSGSKRKSATARFSARLNKKLDRWKTKHSKFAVQHKQKLSRASTEHCEAEAPSSSESTLFYSRYLIPIVTNYF